MALQFFTGTAFDNSAVSNQIVSLPFSNTTPRMLIVVAIRAASSAMVTTVTDRAGSTYVRDHSAIVNSVGMELWHSTIVTPEQGNNVTVTLNSAVADRGIIVAVYEMAHLTTPFDNASTGSSASPTVATTSFSTQATPGQGLVLAAFTVNAADQPWTPGAGYAMRLQTPRQILMLAERHYTAGLVNEVASASTPTSAAKGVIAVAYTAAILPPAVRAMHLFKQRNVWK